MTEKGGLAGAPEREKIVRTEPRAQGESDSESVRRLQRMGAVTAGVSLPRTWVSERGLGVGSPVTVRVLSSGAVVVRSPDDEEERIRTVLHVNEGPPPEHLFRRLIGAYLRGTEEFVVNEPNGISSTTRATVRTFLRRTIHPQIVYEDRDTLVLRDVTKGANLGLPVLLRRMLEVVIAMHEDAGRSWQGVGPTNDEPMETRDDEVDRYAWIIERTLALRMHEDSSTPGIGGTFNGPLPVFLLVRSLERIADHAVILSEQGARLGEAAVSPAVSRALTSYHRQALDNLRSAFAIAEKPEATLANEILDAATALEATHGTLATRFLTSSGSSALPAAAVTALGLALQSIDRTTAYARDIAQLGLSGSETAGRGSPELAPIWNARPVVELAR
jgi:phosphate uptake regulator